MCKLQWNKKTMKSMKACVILCLRVTLLLFLFFYFVVSVNEQLRIVLFQNISKTEILRVRFQISTNLGSISAEFLLVSQSVVVYQF